LILDAHLRHIRRCGKSSLDKLAEILGQFVGAPVMDKTGISGTYEYEVLRSSESAGGILLLRSAGCGVDKWMTVDTLIGYILRREMG
jgi:uncharacterized protein (TIGR03435 family)